MATVISLAGAASVVLVGLMAAPGVSQAKPVKRAAPLYDLSLGDSYSVGYQTPAVQDGPGYTDEVAEREHLQLENFGCGGATTTSLVATIGCKGSQEAGHAVRYPSTTQEQAALHFIAEHPKQIGLITISIGGNDVTDCANAPAGAIGCVLAAKNTILTNVDKLVTDLNTALTKDGDTAKLVGLTYPDVILGDDVYPVGATDPTLAALSVTAFDSLINPTLRAAYTSVPNGSFVNVTSAPYVKGSIAATAGDDTGSWNDSTGVYTGPTTRLRPFGRSVPESVAEVCHLTYYCSISDDIHPDSEGYTFITSLILADLGI
jgi:lysophospholipase L1-like esterase